MLDSIYAQNTIALILHIMSSIIRCKCLPMFLGANIAPVPQKTAATESTQEVKQAEKGKHYPCTEIA